jgi:hypothetical protein
MANPPVQGDSTIASVPGVTGTNSASAATIVLGDPHLAGEAAGVVGYSPQGTGVHGASVSDNGVRGTTGDSSSSGVLGENTGGGNGVYGTSVSGNAVAGKSQTGNAGWFESVSGNGVEGITGNSTMSGVAGANTAGGNGVYGTSVSGNAVAGKSQTGNAGWFESANGIGVYGKGSQHAGYFDGHIQQNGDVTTTGTHTVQGDITAASSISVKGDVVLTGADCAEEFDVHDAREVAAGTVMVVDDDGSLIESDQPYDRRVAGVVSGAGTHRPGLILDRRGTTEGRLPVALVGKVFCKVDATAEAIQVGDLLTSSSAKGHAMKASDPSKAFGAVIGKALRPLPNGRGMIPILVTLQ